MPKTYEHKKPPPADTPFMSIIDPKGREWNVVDSPGFNAMAYEGATGTLLMPPTEDAPIYREAMKYQQMATVRYPLAISEEEVEKLGANGYMLQLARRILRTSALYNKGLPVMTIADPTCAAYINNLIPVIENALGVDDLTAQRLAQMLTAEGIHNGMDRGVKDLCQNWMNKRQGDQEGEQDRETEVLGKLLKSLVKRVEEGREKQNERVGITADEWYKRIWNLKEWDFGETTKGFLPPYLTKIIPGYTAGLDWVKPSIIKPPTKATKISMARGQRVSDTGAIPRLIHRLPIDGRVFSVKRKNVGGSVLIDCSGSMGISQEAILQIATHFPAGIIAGYSGPHLVILADRGRVITDAITWKGTNESDGPALEWLLRQGSPRVWISDGVVTLKGDNQNVSAIQHCEALRQWGGITRIATIQDALQHIAKIMKSN